MYQCPTCGQDTYVNHEEPYLYPEKPKAETEGRVRIAQIKLRGDDGPNGELSPPEKFLQVGDKFYDYKGIQSVPAYHAGQLEFCDE